MAGTGIIYSIMKDDRPAVTLSAYTIAIDGVSANAGDIIKIIAAIRKADSSIADKNIFFIIYPP